MSRNEVNQDWNINKQASGAYSVEAASLAILQDLRDELQKLNRVFECPNFVDIPHKLDRIENNIRRRKPKKRKVPVTK